jgi:hypothetical protein
LHITKQKEEMATRTKIIKTIKGISITSVLSEAGFAKRESSTIRKKISGIIERSLSPHDRTAIMAALDKECARLRQEVQEALK